MVKRGGKNMTKMILKNSAKNSGKNCFAHNFPEKFLKIPEKNFNNG